MNTNMKFSVTGQRIEFTEPVMLVAGTMNIYTASFVFDSAWEGHTKTAVFRGGDVEREQLLTDDACTVPWEVLIAGKYLRVGVYGTKDDIRLPTIWTERTQYINSGAGPTEEAAEPSPTLVEQLMTKVGNLDALKTEDKSSVVAAVNEIWESGGGGTGGGTTDHSKLKNRDAAGQHPMSAITGLEAALEGKQPAGDYLTDKDLDTTLSLNGKAADAGAVGVRLDSLSEDIANLQTSGLTTAQVNALDGMFKVAAYDNSKDVSGAYAAFKAAFGLVDSGGGGEETPDVTTYTITAELVNVTSSNSATSITEGANYNATLTANDGYALDTVTVTMGGVDVTADVYANGVISIPAVTGNVEIVASAAAIEDVEPVLPEDGLLAYFDFRNVAESSGDNSKGYYIPATKGTGRMYGWYKAGGGNDYGSPASTNPDFCAGDSYTIHDFGSEFTWILKSYCSIRYTVKGFKNYIKPSNFGAVLGPTYNTAEGTAAVSEVNIGHVQGYSDVVIRASRGLLSVFVNGKITNEFNGNDISDFVSWYSKAIIGASWNSDNSMPVLTTAAAFYSRALSDAEVVEGCEYLKTLEVSV